MEEWWWEPMTTPVKTKRHVTVLVEGVNNDAVQRQSALMKSKYIVSSPCYLRSLFFKLFYRSSLTNEEKKKTNFHNSWVFTFFWPWKSSCWVWGKTFLQASKPKLCNSNLHCHIDVQPGAAPLTMITGRNKLFSFVSDSADSSLIRSELS